MPLIRYKNKEGKQIPSYSTIVSQWGDGAKGLQYWYWKKGKDGLEFDEMPEADIGTIAHLLVDADAKRKPIDISNYPVDQVEQAKTAFENWLTWKNAYKPEIFATEISLVSEDLQFGGTIDCVMNLQGSLAILDLKTGKDVYPSQIVQIFAYKKLWDENFPEYPITGGAHIIRTGKELPMFVHHFYNEFKQAEEVFLMLRRLYDLAKEIKKLK